MTDDIVGHHLAFPPAGWHFRPMRRFIYDEPVTRWAVWSRRIAWFGLVVLGYAVLLVRGGAQDFRGAAVFGAAFFLIGLAAFAALIAFVRIWRQGFKGVGMAAQALALVIAMSALPGFYLARGALLPKLNDVSTDIDDPPAFSRSRAALAARHDRVPPEIDRATRERQRAAYPTISPLQLDHSVDEAFDLARRSALALGWTIIEQTPPGGRTGAGRIEAMQRTTILKFTDDVTIRVRPRAEGSRIDIRSASRIGQHDFGANARRIRRFFDEIQLLEFVR